MFEGFIFDVEGTHPRRQRLAEPAQPAGCLGEIGSPHPDSDALSLLRPRRFSSRSRKRPNASAALSWRIVVKSSSATTSEREVVGGARDVIRILAEKGRPHRARHGLQRFVLCAIHALLDASDHIAVTACGDDLEHGKPDPRLVGIALRKLGLGGSSQTVMVGDTPYDAEAGLKAGTKAAGVLTGGFPESVLGEAGCFAVARDCGRFFQICCPA